MTADCTYNFYTLRRWLDNSGINDRIFGPTPGAMHLRRQSSCFGSVLTKRVYWIIRFLATPSITPSVPVMVFRRELIILFPRLTVGCADEPRSETALELLKQESVEVLVSASE